MAAARRVRRQVLAAPAGPAAGYPPQDLRPGAAMGIGMSTGDIAVGSIGTVTYRDGPALWAFGHELDAAGAAVAAAHGRVRVLGDQQPGRDRGRRHLQVRRLRPHGRHAVQRHLRRRGRPGRRAAAHDPAGDDGARPRHRPDPDHPQPGGRRARARAGLEPGDGGHLLARAGLAAAARGQPPARVDPAVPEHRRSARAAGPWASATATSTRSGRWRTPPAPSGWWMGSSSAG